MIRRRLLAVAAAALFAGAAVPARAQKLVFVVRHAERADGGNGSMGADPPLSAAGEARASKLAAMLSASGIKAIVATEFKRTQDTAKPLAAELHLAIERGSSGDTAALVAKLKREHAGDIVLVVGHSNTLPDIIKGFGGPAIAIGDNDYDNLFIVVPATGALTRIKF